MIITECPVCGGEMYKLKRSGHDYFICCRPSCSCTYDAVEGYYIPSTAQPTVSQLLSIDFINTNLHADFHPLTSLEAYKIIEECGDIASIIYNAEDNVPF